MALALMIPLTTLSSIITSLKILIKRTMVHSETNGTMAIPQEGISGVIIQALIDTTAPARIYLEMTGLEIRTIR